MCGWSIMSATRLETDVLMAESTLVTVLGGFAARIDVAILPAASQESMAARHHYTLMMMAEILGLFAVLQTSRPDLEQLFLLFWH